MAEAIMSKWQIFGIIVGAMVALYKPAKEIILCIVRRTRQIDGERKRVRELIGMRYFEMMCVVKTAREQANKVDERNMGFLDDVNCSLKTMSRLLRNSVNTGSATDVELSDIRNAFGNGAATIVKAMTEKLDALDSEWQEQGFSSTTCSSRVVGFCDSVLGQWEKLVSIMAKKLAMTPDELTQHFREKMNGE